MKIKFLPVLLLLGAFFASCSSEEIIKEPAPDGAYVDGFLVLNEGNFLSGNASVSFIGNSGEVSHSIFKNANSGAALGDTATDLQFYEDYAFIVVNVSNKIEVVDRYTFESVATIDNGLINPRKISFSNGYAYVTNWGDASDPGDDFIAVFDAETFQQTQIVPVAEGPENMLVENSRLFVAHLGGWGFNNIITVIHTATNELEKTIEVGDLPNSLVVENGFLWVASSGLPFYAEGGETNGSISKINLTSLEVATEFEVQGHPSYLVNDGGILYYTIDNSIFSFSPAGESLSETPLLKLEEVSVLYGFSVKDDLIYATSANADFTGDGKLFIYNSLKNFEAQTFTTGINPNGIFFQ